MEAWPVQFQTLLNEDSFTMQLGETTVRSTVDAGVPKVRSRYTKGMDTISCSIYIDYDLVAILKSFFKITLANGSRTFAFDDPFTGDPSEWRFAEPPTVTPLGGREFKVSMRWELMP